MICYAIISAPCNTIATFCQLACLHIRVKWEQSYHKIRLFIHSLFVSDHEDLYKQDTKTDRKTGGQNLTTQLHKMTRTREVRVRGVN